jgi:hypothetical protein
MVKLVADEELQYGRWLMLGAILQTLISVVAKYGNHVMMTCIWTRDIISIYTKLYDTIRYFSVRSCAEQVPLSLMSHVQLLRIYV